MKMFRITNAFTNKCRIANSAGQTTYKMNIITNKITIFLFCLFQINFLCSQTELDGREKTHHYITQIDTTYNVNGVKVRVFKSEQPFYIIDNTSSYFNVHSGSVVFCHYDSLNRLRIDSVIHDKWGTTDYYHYVNGKRKLKYTYYSDKDINVSKTEIRNDSVAIVNVARFKDNDTVFQDDTIFLYYPDSGSVDYFNNNITLEALAEKAYSSDTSDNNKMRIFMMKYGDDTTDFVVLYTISDIFKKPLQVTRKTGNYLWHSLFESKEDKIKQYKYESTHKKIVNKKINKVLKEITSLNKPLLIDNFMESLLVEYVINGKYYYLTYPYDITDFSISGNPMWREEDEILELVKKLVICLESYF